MENVDVRQGGPRDWIEHFLPKEIQIDIDNTVRTPFQEKGSHSSIMTKSILFLGPQEAEGEDLLRIMEYKGNNEFAVNVRTIICDPDIATELEEQFSQIRTVRQNTILILYNFSALVLSNRADDILTRLSSWLDRLGMASENRKVCVVASLAGLDETYMTHHGNLISLIVNKFDKIYLLRPPNEEEINNILRYQIKQIESSANLKVDNDVDYERLSRILQRHAFRTFETLARTVIGKVSGRKGGKRRIRHEDILAATRGLQKPSWSTLLRVIEKGGFHTIPPYDVLEEKPITINRSWSDVAGLDRVKVVLDLIAQRCRDKGRRAGVLLWGPPGCGKTHLIEVLASVYDFEFIPADGTDLTSKYYSVSEKLVQAMFDRAESIAQSGRPVAIFVDEADSLLPCRDSIPDYKSDVVNVFLKNMSKSSEYPILVVLATNRRDKMDATALRDGRVNDHIFVGLPGIDGYKSIWKMYLDKITKEEGAKISSDVSIDDLAALSYQRLTPASIKEICGEFATVTQLKPGKQEKITHDQLADAISRRIRKVKRELLGFEELLATYGESGFITNPEIKKYLEDKEWRKKLSLTQSSEEAMSYNIPKPKDLHPASFIDIVGLENAKILMHSSIKFLLKTKSSDSRMMFLLYGPPGYGKTMFARATATYFDCGFRGVKKADFTGPYRGEPTLKLQAIFDTALSQAENSEKPIILFFDEAEMMFPERGNSKFSRSEEEALTTFLSATDGLTASNNVIVILSSNRPDRFDSAVKSRITHPIRVWPSGISKASAEVWRRTFQKRILDAEGVLLPKDIDWIEIGKQSHAKAISYRQISVMVNDIVHDIYQTLDEGSVATISKFEILNRIQYAPDEHEQIRRSEIALKSLGESYDKQVGPLLFQKYMDNPSLCEELNLDSELIKIRPYTPYEKEVVDFGTDDPPTDDQLDEDVKPMSGLRAHFEVTSSGSETFSYFPRDLLAKLLVGLEGIVEIEGPNGHRVETTACAHERPSKSLVQLSNKVLKTLNLKMGGAKKSILTIRKKNGTDGK